MSQELPLAFLQGCGIPESLIAYLPSLRNRPFEFYSCFISYADVRRQLELCFECVWRIAFADHGRCKGIDVSGERTRALDWPGYCGPRAASSACHCRSPESRGTTP